MVKAIPIEYLYERFEGKSFSILGAAPNLKRELAENPPQEGGVTLVLNSAFLAYPSYTVHLVANREFLEKYQGSFKKTGIALKPNSFQSLGYAEEFFFFPSKTVGESEELMRARNNSLVAGHSCLVPALHFALRCSPPVVKLYGIDLTTNLHWDVRNQVKVSEFPSWRRICQEVKTVKEVFNYRNIICLNQRSALVLKKVVEYGN